MLYVMPAVGQVIERFDEKCTPTPGIEPGPSGWKPDILATRPRGKAACRMPISVTPSETLWLRCWFVPTKPGATSGARSRQMASTLGQWTTWISSRTAARKYRTADVRAAPQSFNVHRPAPVQFGSADRTVQLTQDYFTNKVCSVGKSYIPRDVTQGNPLRPSP